MSCSKSAAACRCRKTSSPTSCTIPSSSLAAKVMDEAIDLAIKGHSPCPEHAADEDRVTGGVLIACFAIGCAALLLVLLFFAPRTHAALYVGNAEGIGRMNLDGSLLEANFINTGSGGICAIAVNSSHIYWADNWDHTIGRARLDGQAVENDFITLADGTVPCGLALDSKFLYWSSMGINTVGRARLDGSEILESFIPTGEHPCAVAVNQSNIYWASDSEHEIWRTDIAGTKAQELVIAEDAVNPCGIALDGPYLYWAESNRGTIGRANLDGSEPTAQFVSGGHSPVSLVAHEGSLYWTNVKWGSQSIGRSSIDGSNVNQAFITGLEYPYALAADSAPVVPRPPVPPQPASALKLGKLRRQQDGSIIFPVDLLGDGWFEAVAPGARVRVQPEGIEGHAMLEAGRKWLKITPTTRRGAGSRCILRAFRLGVKVQLALRLSFLEPGKASFAVNRPFLLFNPRLAQRIHLKRRRAPITCTAKPGGRVSRSTLDEQ